MENIVLIGMPGCGKSTLGVILAKELGMDFVDTDIVIQQRTGQLLQTTLETRGVEALLDEEQDAVLSLDMSKGRVIATGGSAVLRERSAEHLHVNSVCIYLQLSLSQIEKRVINRNSRGIAADKNHTLSDIYSFRVPYYEKNADICIDCNNSTVEEIVERIVKELTDRFDVRSISKVIL